MYFGFNLYAIRNIVKFCAFFFFPMQNCITIARNSKEECSLFSELKKGENKKYGETVKSSLH